MLLKNKKKPFQCWNGFFLKFNQLFKLISQNNRLYFYIIFLKEKSIISHHSIESFSLLKNLKNN